MSKNTKPAVSFYGNISALDAAFEGLDSSLNSPDKMSVEVCAKAHLDEALARIAGFTPRPDKVQDAVNKHLATLLLDSDAPIAALFDNIISAVRSLKASDDTPSNAAACGVTEAPVGTAADKVRDRLESLLLFVRSLNRQVARGSFYRKRQVEQIVDARTARMQSAKKNAAGEFVGDFSTFATLDDRSYPGWNRVTVDGDTIVEAAEQIGEALKALYNRVCTSGAVSEWFVSNNPFDYGSVAVEGAVGQYEHYVSVSDAHEALAKTIASNTRERATASEILGGFHI